ncbi:MAG: hypothetical protein R2932_15495 [Caldilineaceae bacterium]
MNNVRWQISLSTDPVFRLKRATLNCALVSVAALLALTGSFSAAVNARIIAGIVAYFVLRLVLARSTAVANAKMNGRTA